jgi:hypothetical protein|tara:strand:- start:1417 stop:1830 length:414 start_codon:yes stop_codon:yes gene_type:complete
MIEEIKNIKSEKSDLRKFGITVGIILIIVVGFLFWKEKESFQILLTAGVVLLILGLTIPVILKPIYWVWMVFATILGWLMTRVILTLLFYVILSPIGLIARLLGKQFLDLKLNHLQQSYWSMRTVEPSNTQNYEKQF